MNIQGDEPFLHKESLKQLLDAFYSADGKTVQVASLMRVINNEEMINNPNCVKVVVDKNMNSLLFSRSAIPYPRDVQSKATYYQHIGIYAFRKNALMTFTNWELTPLEAAEKIECLRYLEHGIPLKMVVVDYMGIEIDTPEDLERAAKYL